MKDSDSRNIKDLEARVKELESVVGRKQIMIDYLEKMMEIAKEELDIDIKKTSSPHNQLVQEKQRKKATLFRTPHPTN